MRTASSPWPIGRIGCSAAKKLGMNAGPTAAPDAGTPTTSSPIAASAMPSGPSSRPSPTVTEEAANEISMPSPASSR